MFAHGTVHFMLLWHNYFVLYYYIQHHHYHHFHLIYMYCFILYCYFMLLSHNYLLLYYYIQHHHYHHFYLIYMYCFILYCMYVIVRIITYINVQWWQHASGISHNALMLSPRDIYSHKSYHKLFCIHVFCEINISYSYYSYSSYYLILLYL